MSEQELNSDEEASNETTPDEKGEFATMEDFKNLQKGVEKLASSINSSKGNDNEDEDEDDSDSTHNDDSYNPVIKKIYFKDTPEIKEVWDEVAKEAEELGKDPIEHYENSKGWQLEAKRLVGAKKEKQKAKDDIESPDGTMPKDTKINFDKIKPEQISKLTEEQKTAYRAYLTKKEGGTTIIRRG